MINHHASCPEFKTYQLNENVRLWRSVVVASSLIVSLCVTSIWNIYDTIVLGRRVDALEARCGELESRPTPAPHVVVLGARDGECWNFGKGFFKDINNAWGDPDAVKPPIPLAK